jgi:hypothetical protein
VSETYENMRTNKPARKPSASVHPEDSQWEAEKKTASIFNLI